MSYYLAVIIPLLGAALAGAVTGWKQRKTPVFRQLTQSELFSEQKELSRWLVRTASEMDVLHPSKDRVEAVLKGLGDLQDSAFNKKFDFYDAAFRDALSSAKTLYENLDSIPHPQFVPKLRLLTDLVTKVILENRGNKPEFSYANLLAMSQIKKSFNRLVSDVNEEQLKQWKSLPKGTS